MALSMDEKWTLFFSYLLPKLLTEIGHIFHNKVLKNKAIKNVSNKSCFLSLNLLEENYFQRDSKAFLQFKMTLKIKLLQSLIAKLVILVGKSKS